MTKCTVCLEVEKSKEQMGITSSFTLNDLFEIWKKLKRGLKDNTFQNYCYMYNQFVRPTIGSMQIQKMKRSDIRNFYNMLVDERNLKINTVDNIHSCLHQVIEIYSDPFCQDNFLLNLSLGDKHMFL